MATLKRQKWWLILKVLSIWPYGVTVVFVRYVGYLKTKVKIIALGPWKTISLYTASHFVYSPSSVSLSGNGAGH